MKIQDLLMISVIVIGLLTPLSLYHCPTSSEPIIDSLQYDTSDQIDDHMREYMQQGHIPGLSACIIKKDTIVWQRQYGYSNYYLHRNVTEDTIFLAASLTKTVTATAIMQLWEEDYFELDDDVNDYLPFPLRNPHYPDESITFRMLLSHHSSLAIGENNSVYLFFSLLGFNEPLLRSCLLPSGLLYQSNIWLQSPPGETLEYSSMGYLLLQYLVELISQQSFEDYCTEHILTPLHMHNTSFYVQDYYKYDLARPYLWVFDQYIPLVHYEIKYSGVGGLRTTISDLSHYLIAHMNEGVYKGHHILNKETIDLIRTIQYPWQNQTTWYSYGLGWRVSVFNESYSIGHVGAMPGVANFMTYQPARDAGFILFTNQYPILYGYDFMSWINILLLLYEKSAEY